MCDTEQEKNLSNISIDLQEVPQDITRDKRPQFGNRLLTNEDDVFIHNAWFLSEFEYTRFRKKPARGDRILKNPKEIFEFNTWDKVEWDEEQEREAMDAVSKNSIEKLCEEDRVKFQNEANEFWDAFYGIHQSRFFKDRHWLFTEFPELAPACKEATAETETAETETAETTKSEHNGRGRIIFELGCGVGNTILPILNYSREPSLKIFGCDFSEKAIEILRNSPEFDAKRCEVFVMDATLEKWTVPFDEGSLDTIVLIYVLSAIEPTKMQRIVANCYKYLRPGGLVLFRDYGRYDLVQLRFKSGKCIEDNFYVRGDGTMVYFFTQQELRDMFLGVGFEEVQSVVDRRLQVNRGRMLKMYRVWIQTKYRKPDFDTSTAQE